MDKKQRNHFILYALVSAILVLNLLILYVVMDLKFHPKSQLGIIGTFSTGEAPNTRNIAFGKSGAYIRFDGEKHLSEGTYKRIFDSEQEFNKVYVLTAQDGMEDGVFILSDDIATYVNGEDNGEKMLFYYTKTSEIPVIVQGESEIKL